MKKLSVIIALAVCLTIGGVYAAWTYPGNTSQVSQHATLGIQMNANENDSIGTFSILVDGGSQNPFKIEPTSSSDFTATFLAQHQVTIVFTPKTNAAQSVLENGIDAYWYFTNGDKLLSTTYEGNPIFSYQEANGATNAQKIWAANSGEANCFVKDGSVFKYNITNDLLAAIKLRDNIVLDSKADYDAFIASLGQDFVFGLTVTNINPNA